VSLPVTPEQAGLVGCWQFLAIERERQELTPDAHGVLAPLQRETAFYACSRTTDEASTQELAGHVRRHWGAIENGAHHRRDVTFDEDRCPIKHRGASQIMATLRNLALGLYELNVPRKEAQNGIGEAERGFASWQRQLTQAEAVAFFRR